MVVRTIRLDPNPGCYCARPRVYSRNGSHDRETVSDLFRRLDGDFEAEVGFERLDDRLQSSSTIIVHPDQKLAIGPPEQVYRGQKEDRQYPQQPIHGAENLPGFKPAQRENLTKQSAREIFALR